MASSPGISKFRIDPFIPMCACCQPNMLHAFGYRDNEESGDDLVCPCGVTWQQHQQKPERCRDEVGINGKRHTSGREEVPAQ